VIIKLDGVAVDTITGTLQDSSDTDTVSQFTY